MKTSTFLFIMAAVMLGIFLFLIRDLYLPGDAQPTVPPEPVACTMDAKLCPDGSAVGRVPPSCEFAPCPGENALPQPPTDEVFCTMDARICPDGTSVGRIPPRCEFAPCPGEVSGATGGDLFAQCAAAGNPVMKSLPQQCQWPNGTIVVERLP